MKFRSVIPRSFLFVAGIGRTRKSKKGSAGGEIILTPH